MLEYLKFFLLFNNVILIMSELKTEADELNTKVVSPRNYMLWPNATIPFYITPDHFDEEQTLTIMRTLSLFAFKTCLKFVPVLDAPAEGSHVMTFVNPSGIKRCTFESTGLSAYKSYSVPLGYECLKSPDIDMMIMRALGFPFEHNRMSRDLYTNIRFENIEPGAVELFTKDIALPTELRVLPYDINSVMHFDHRAFSKNGHRTITFKNPNLVQNRVGLTQNDVKKISIVYLDECHKRDRQEKIELCQSYPGIARKKREVDNPGNLKSLRVNPNITPPAAVEENENEDSGLDNEKLEKLKSQVAALGVDKEMNALVDQVQKVTRQALKVAKERYCNATANQTAVNNQTEVRPNIKLSNIVESVAAFTAAAVEDSIGNLTEFCSQDEIPSALRLLIQPCKWSHSVNCKERYWSTKSGRVHYSTKHHPEIHQSTKHRGIGHHYSYDKMQFRSGTENDTETTTEQIRVKREVATDLSEKDNKNSSKSDKDGLVVQRRFFERRSHGGDKEQEEWAASAVSDEKETDSPQEVSEVGTGDDEVTTKSKIKIRETVDFGDKELMKTHEGDSTESDVETTTVKHLKSKSKEKLKIRNINLDKTLDKKNKSPKYKKHRAIPETLNMTKMNRDFYNERRWLEGTVRYIISPVEDYDLADMRLRLGAVAKVLKKKTCVTLEEVTEEEAANHEDYLVIDTSPDYVTGRVGGKQHFGSIELFKGGQHKQHAAMMVMAMLGFYFEVARHDRDKHIRVHMRHVRPDKLHHFEKIREEATLDTPYDFNSAMHPAWQFWRKIGKTGISTVATFKDKDPDGSIMRNLGQHDKLFSDADILKINSVYGIECFTENGERRAAYTKGSF